MLVCQCGSFYIGKTKQECHKRAYRHILSMKKSNSDLPLGRHVRDAHASKISQIKFLILDRLHPSARGGDWNRILLQREIRWIINLNATLPSGLNYMVSYHPFLEGFSTGGWEEKGCTFFDICWVFSILSLFPLFTINLLPPFSLLFNIRRKYFCYVVLPVSKYMNANLYTSVLLIRIGLLPWCVYFCPSLSLF